jgi:hypothetical protein
MVDAGNFGTGELGDLEARGITPSITGAISD